MKHLTRLNIILYFISAPLIIAGGILCIFDYSTNTLILLLIGVLLLIASGIFHIIYHRLHNESFSYQVYKYMSEAVVFTDVDLNITYANDSMSELSGYSIDEILGNKPSMFKSGVHDNQFYDKLWYALNHKGFWEGIIVNKRKNGELYEFRTRISRVDNKFGQQIGYLSIRDDLKHFKKVEQERYNYLYYSITTGLANELSMVNRLNELISKQTSFKLILCRIYDYDTIYTRYGEDSYVSIFQQIEKKVNAIDCVKGVFEMNHHTIAIVSHCDYMSSQVVQYIHQQIQSVKIENKKINLYMKYGVSQYPEHGKTPKNILIKGYQALKFAVESDKDMYFIYNQHMDEQLKYEFEIEKSLLYAIKNKHIHLHYQPIIDIKNNKIYAYEVLLRWTHEKLGYISPPLCISIAQKYRHMHALNVHIIEEALMGYKKLSEVNPGIRIAINLSVYDYVEDHFLSKMLDLCKKHQVLPEQVICEITETQNLKDTKALEKQIRRFKEAGFIISLDDFGSGYNSLSKLLEISFDEIKIDKSFINKDLNLLKSLVDIGHSMNKNVVVEGVETSQQLEQLSKISCDYVQGYYHLKPKPIEDVLIWAKAF